MSASSSALRIFSDCVGAVRDDKYARAAPEKRLAHRELLASPAPHGVARRGMANHIGQLALRVGAGETLLPMSKVHVYVSEIKGTIIASKHPKMWRGKVKGAL